MDNNNTTSYSKTIKGYFINAQSNSKRELSRQILCKIPGLNLYNIQYKKTCKDDPFKNSKRAEEQFKGNSLSKSKDTSISKLKRIVSEKMVDPRFSTTKLQSTKKQVYVPLIDHSHFVNPKYLKVDQDKGNRGKIVVHQRHKSNILLTKQTQSKDECYQKNHSLLVTLTNKNIGIKRVKDIKTQNNNMKKSIVVPRKKGSCSLFAKEKINKPFIEIDESRHNIAIKNKIPFLSSNNSPMHLLINKKSVDPKDANVLKNYFFNLQMIKNGHHRPKQQSMIDNKSKSRQTSSSMNRKYPQLSAKRLNKHIVPSRDITIATDNNEPFIEISHINDTRRSTAPQFTEVLRNIYKNKETKDVKNLKTYVEDYINEHNKVPETTLQFYQIIKLLGRGSFGKVYLGLQRLTNRLVAIKCLEKCQFKDESKKRKIFAEINILKKLRDHPNIVTLLEVFENKKYVFFVTEYATNGDLLKYTKANEQLTENDAKYMFYQITMGLRYIHQQDIIHRDIKLDNILVDESNRCKICDFGVSKRIDPNELIMDQCGTPAYIAPEIILDEGYKGFSADIWSLGVLLFSLLTGCMPFKSNTIEDLHKKILEGKYEFPENSRPTPEAIDLISKMIVLEPERRLTIEEVIRHNWVKSIDFNTTTIKNIKEFEKCQNSYLVAYKYEINDFALNHVCELGFSREVVEESITNKELNHASACYFNLEKDFV